MRVGIAYAVVGWFLAQVAEFAFENFGAPPWVLKSIVIVLLLGLPLALFFAWAFELTPEGVKRDADVDRSKSVTQSTGRKLDRVIIGALVVALAYFVWERQTDIEPVATVAAPGSAVDVEDVAISSNNRSIAVLPFVNMSADQENEYFADGLSEELLNQLAQVPNLQVAGRTSSFSFKGKNDDLRTIGTTLGVANVLEGSVRRQGDKVRVTAQLIRVEDGFHLWSNTYDRTMDDVFVIQDDISSSVAAALKIVLDDVSFARMQRAGVRNVDAFVGFQKGMELFNLAHTGGSDLMESLREGIIYFDQAIELVPEFGAAYWRKSDYYGHVILDPTSTRQQRALALQDLREVLDAAYTLSVDSPRRPFVDFDRVLFSDDWTPLKDRAEKALAVTGCPEPTWIEVAIGIGYAQISKEMWGRYKRCEPLDSSSLIKLADAELYLGNYDAAHKRIDESDVQFGAQAWTAATRQFIFLAQGRPDDALAIAPEVENDTDFFGMSARALPLAMSGDVDSARAAMQDWQARNGRNRRNEIEIYAAIGDRKQANKVAAEVDASPGGTMLLLLTSVYCACGAPFDLEATPNFRERIKEAGLDWPLEKHIHYPAKDW